MQMNRWLTHVEPENGEPSEGASHRPIRRRASVWIDPVVQQHVSASSILKKRRSIPNPSTPIPARASAQPVKVRPRYPRRSIISQESDMTRMPTLPQSTMWQYELPDYDAESSLSSLSLAYPETPADHAVDEIDTLPPPWTRTIDEVDTLPPPEHNTFAAQKSAATSERKHAKGKPFSFPFSQSSEPRRKQSLTLPAPHALREVTPIHPQATTVAVPRVPHTQKMPGLLPAVRTTSTLVESALSKRVEETASWTTGQGKNSLLAQRIASRTNSRRGQRKSSLSLNPIDRMRWWLLFPGRIEFLLWLNGTIVLVAVTCLLLFATLLSTGWMSTGFSSIAIGVGGGATQPTGGTPAAGGSKSASGKSSSCGAENASSPQCQSTTVISASGLQLTLVDNTILLPNTPIYLHGQSFSPNNTVTFSYDTSLPCRPSTTATDTQGSFSIFLMLGVGVKAGTHSIVAYDVASKRSVKVNVTISPSPIGKGVPPTPTPLPPGVTPTVTTVSGGGGGLPTPVGQTPAPITPTVGVTPTAVPTQRPTPTAGVTPPPTVGVTPTVGTTPTVGITQTPTGTKHVSPASLLKNSLYDEHVDRHLTLSPWLWVAIIGYMLSMTMLGLAGILYRRNRRLPLR